MTWVIYILYIQNQTLLYHFGRIDTILHFRHFRWLNEFSKLNDECETVKTHHTGGNCFLGDRHKDSWKITKVPRCFREKNKKPCVFFVFCGGFAVTFLKFFVISKGFINPEKIPSTFDPRKAVKTWQLFHVSFHRPILVIWYMVFTPKGAPNSWQLCVTSWPFWDGEWKRDPNSKVFRRLSDLQRLGMKRSLWITQLRWCCCL